MNVWRALLVVVAISLLSWQPLHNSDVADAQQASDCVVNQVWAKFQIGTAGQSGLLTLQCLVLSGETFIIFPVGAWTADAGNNNPGDKCVKDKGPLPDGAWNIYSPVSNVNYRDNGKLVDSKTGYPVWKSGICNGRYGFFVHAQGTTRGCIAVHSYANFQTVIDDLFANKVTTTDAGHKVIPLDVIYQGFAPNAASDPSFNAAAADGDCSTCEIDICASVGGFAEPPGLPASAATGRYGHVRLVFSLMAAAALITAVVVIGKRTGVRGGS